VSAGVGACHPRTDAQLAVKAAQAKVKGAIAQLKAAQNK
jgi:hypothetical protein